MPPKWFVKSKAFWGIITTALAVILGDGGWVNIPVVTEILEGLLQDGFITFGTVLGLFGNAVRKHKLVLWRSDAG